jgi:hypothetical protein
MFRPKSNFIFCWSFKVIIKWIKEVFFCLFGSDISCTLSFWIFQDIADNGFSGFWFRTHDHRHNLNNRRTYKVKFLVWDFTFHRKESCWLIFKLMFRTQSFCHILFNELSSCHSWRFFSSTYILAVLCICIFCKPLHYTWILIEIILNEDWWVIITCQNYIE